MGMNILVAMSGGVDSTAAALLLRQQGYEAIGVTLLLADRGEAGRRDVDDARRAAHRLGMEHIVLDERALFQKEVVDRFIRGYRDGETPNPCVDCNRLIKFGRLLEHARDLSADAVATGHYARIESDPESGRFLLKRGRDPGKDQSYVLYSLTQDQLAHVRLPLGDHTKDEIRKLVEKDGLIPADRPESQDICFVPDGDYAAFIEEQRQVQSEPGDFVDASGRVLGRHNGLIRYTVGQRKGIGIAAEHPLYVLRKDPKANRVVLGPSEALDTRELHARSFNWILKEKADKPMTVTVRTRYHQKEQAGTLVPPDPDGTVRILLDQPVRAAAPGQAVVCYQGEDVVGGGTLIRSPG